MPPGKTPNPDTTRQLSILALISVIQSLSLDDIKNIDGIGDKIAETLYEWFNNEKNQKFLEKLYNAGIILTTDSLQSSGSLSGKSFVLTGSLSTMTRDQAKTLIKSKGGKIHSTITKDTDLLIAGEAAGSKLKKAEDMGVKIINEEEFNSMLR